MVTNISYFSRFLLSNGEDSLMHRRGPFIAMTAVTQRKRGAQTNCYDHIEEWEDECYLIELMLSSQILALLILVSLILA